MKLLRARSGAAGGDRSARPTGGRGARTGERVGFNANPLLAVKLPAWRSKALLFGLFCAFLMLVGRSVYLQSGMNPGLQQRGDARYSRTLDVPATRGKVTDRNGVVLAASVPARAIWAIPEDVDATPAQVAQLARLLDLPVAELKRRLGNDDRSFVYLRRQVDPTVADAIAKLKLAGIHSTREFKRFYPEGAAAAHVVGFTNLEDRGQEGIELANERLLAGRTGSRRVIKDNLGRVVEDNWLREPFDGSDLSLAIDNRIQYVAMTALRQSIEQHNAKAGAAIVLDVHTGEVLALANWPSFDPNVRNDQRRARWNLDTLRNRAITDIFEPGSTLKPFSVAAAMDAGLARPEQRVNTAPGRIVVGGRTISDTHPNDVLTVEQIVAKSSNVGTVKLTIDMPAERLWSTYAGVGFGQAPSAQELGFSGAVAGRLRPYKAWRPVEQATIAYGYGVSVSLLQLARAYTAFARDGDVVPVSLLKRDAPPASVQVFKPETARAMRKMLEQAVSDEGTAPQARIAGYRVAGKTGTARKLKDGQYVNAYVGSFAGFAPVSDPRIVVAVMIDEPGGGRYYGGDVAAPVFAQIAAGALRTLQVAPDGPAAPSPRIVAQIREGM
jgi:cell division protein FtsI (penicillin-binding protein 3)